VNSLLTHTHAHTHTQFKKDSEKCDGTKAAEKTTHKKETSERARDFAWLMRCGKPGLDLSARSTGMDFLRSFLLLWELYF
jgi:hypothetical protein